MKKLSAIIVLVTSIAILFSSVNAAMETGKVLNKTAQIESIFQN